ncbi:MAG: hypothetical protein ACE5K3_05935 [bacterium]
MENEEADERVRKYMIRPILFLKKLSFDETEGKVSYQYGNATSAPRSQAGTYDSSRGEVGVQAIDTAVLSVICSFQDFS